MLEAERLSPNENADERCRREEGKKDTLAGEQTPGSARIAYVNEVQEAADKADRVRFSVGAKREA